jgi:hypothetical protein
MTEDEFGNIARSFEAGEETWWHFEVGFIGDKFSPVDYRLSVNECNRAESRIPYRAASAFCVTSYRMPISVLRLRSLAGKVFHSWHLRWTLFSIREVGLR